MLKEYLKNLGRSTIQHPPMRLKNYTRSYIPELCKSFGLKYGAEVGVASGDFSLQFCQTIPDLKLLCVDSWQVGDDSMSISRGQEGADKRFKEAKEKLKGYNVKFLRGKSMDIVREIPYESLDFVYIDACHEFDYVAQDIIEWAKRVKKGGLVSGHDYYKFRNAGVIEAVDAYIKCHKIHDAFITKEITPSWFWCK